MTMTSFISDFEWQADKHCQAISVLFAKHQNQVKFLLLY
jgi:hypothetical protein